MTQDRRLVPANEGTEDADAELLWQAIARSEALLEDLAADELSTLKFDAFLGYLYEIVLARTSEEELELLPALRAAGPFTRSDADRLHQDHLLIRNDIEQLAAEQAQRTTGHRAHPATHRASRGTLTRGSRSTVQAPRSPRA